MSAIESGSAALELGAAGAFEQNSLTGGGTFRGAEFTASDPAQEGRGTLYADFGKHSDFIRQSTESGKISVCVVCGQPQRPAWIEGGFGTALKPAMELICLARKPLSEKCVSANVLRWGTGALNIDGCRIGTTGNLGRKLLPAKGWKNSSALNGSVNEDWKRGRWPANICHDGSPEVLTGFPDTKSGIAIQRNGGGQRIGGNGIYGGSNGLTRDDVGFNDSGSTARFFASFPQEECPPPGRWPATVITDGSAEVLTGFPETKAGGYPAVRNAGGGIGNDGHKGGMTGLNERSTDSGSAARFFYSAKASKADRAGSKHPTVKPVALMQWLVRLITPPCVEAWECVDCSNEQDDSARNCKACGRPLVKRTRRGVILDPFAGSGTTGAAALAEGFDCILIEREAEYLADIERRMQNCENASQPPKKKPTRAKSAPAERRMQPREEPDAAPLPLFAAE